MAGRDEREVDRDRIAPTYVVPMSMVATRGGSSTCIPTYMHNCRPATFENNITDVACDHWRIQRTVFSGGGGQVLAEGSNPPHFQVSPRISATLF